MFGKKGSGVCIFLMFPVILIQNLQSKTHSQSALNAGRREHDRFQSIEDGEDYGYDGESLLWSEEIVRTSLKGQLKSMFLVFQIVLFTLFNHCCFFVKILINNISLRLR